MSNIQHNYVWANVQKFLRLNADGYAGKDTLEKVAMTLGVAPSWKLIQSKVGVKDDGVAGINTARAVSEALKIPVPANVPTQTEIRSEKSRFGKAGDESNLMKMKFPYPMYYDGKPIASTRVHKLVRTPLLRALEKVKNFYATYAASHGEKDPLFYIKKLGLDQYDGCFNNRSTTSGRAKSMHAWGIALDFDASNNGYSMKQPNARLSKPEAKYFVDILEEEGFYSLGRRSDVDWMHFQYAKFS